MDSPPGPHVNTLGTITPVAYSVRADAPRYYVRVTQPYTRLVHVRTPEAFVRIEQSAGYAVSVSRRPVMVVTAGVQGPKGAPGDGETAGYDAENVGAVPLAIGVPVAVGPAGTGIVGASAADNTKPAVGLLAQATQPGFAGQVQTAGVLTLLDWTAATGAAALSIRAPYFLDVLAAKLTTVPPTGSGQIVQYLGRAVGPQSLAIQPHNFIRKG